MKALDPPRKRVILYIFLQVLFMVASFVERHARMGVWLPCVLAAVLFMFLGLRARYNLADEPYR